MTNFFSKQLNNVTWNSSKVKNYPPKYFNGDEYQKNDKVLIALLQKPSNPPIIDNIPSYDIEVISLNERHFDYFDNSFIPLPDSIIHVIKFK